MATLSTNIIASMEFDADGYTYTLDVEEVGASADTNDIAVITPIVMRCGDENYAPLEPILERSVQFRMRDAAGYLQGQFTSAGVNQHLLNLKRDSTTIFRGYIETGFQSYLAWLTNPEFDVLAFDGLALLDGYPWLRSGDETLREQLYAITTLTGLGLVTNIVGEWKHDGADASTEPPDALRWRSEDWLPENSTYGDALRALCQFFNAQFFQRNGEWWFVQRTERGASMTVYPTDAAGAADTAYTYDPDYTASGALLFRNSTEVIEHPSTSLVTIKQEWIDRGLRNGGFELLNSRYWGDGGTGALASASGGWTMDTNGDYVEQEVGHTLMAVNATRDKLVVHLDFSMEVDASASGTGTVGNAFLDYLEIKLIEADGTVSYDDGATGGSNAWTATPTYVQYPFLLAASAGTTVSETDLKWTTPVAPSSPCKIVVKFIFQSNPNSDGDYINSFTINRAWVYHARPDAEDDIERPDAFTYAQGNTQGGEHLEQSFILGDAYDRHLTPGVMQYYDGADWQFTTDWNGSGQKIHKKRLDDIVAQLGARVPGYSFGHLWGEDVDALSSIGYGGSVYTPVFEERIIHPVGKHSVRTTGYKLLGVTHAPSAVPGTIFFTVGTSSNSLVTANSISRRNLDGTTQTLVTLASAPGDISIDEESRRIYYSVGDQIRSCFYDGSDDTLVHDHGTGSVLGIQYMAAGSAAGYIYWIFEDSLGDFRVRRVYKDGTGSGQVSTGTFEGAGGIRRYSDSLLYCNGQYITTSVFSVGITPTNIPAVVNSNYGIGSNSGIAIDFDNDAVFVNQGGGGSQRLVKYDPPNNATGVDYTAVISPASGGYLNYDSTGARLLIPGTGLKSRAISSPSSESEITPLTGGSGTTGNYEVFSAYAIQ